MISQEMPAPAQGRSSEFNAGAGTSQMQVNPSQSLADAGAHFMQGVSTHVAPSLLSPFTSGGFRNGNAPADAQRKLILGGQAPSPNGVAQDTYQAQLQLSPYRSI